MTQSSNRSNYDVKLIAPNMSARTNAKSLAIEISVDITKGYFDKFPHVKKVLSSVRSKLNGSIAHIDSLGAKDNQFVELTTFEFTTLQGNGYIENVITTPPSNKVV